MTVTVKRVTPEEFKKQDVKAGTKERFAVVVGEFSNGGEVSLPVVVVKGKKDGPVVYIAAGTHGEECNSIDAAKRFAANLSPDDVFGTAIVAPLQNIPAWTFRSRHYPLDATTFGDLYSMKSGDPNGVLSSRVMSAIVDSIALKANFALDVHSTHLDSMNYPFTSVPAGGEESPEVQKKRLELAEKIGNEILWVSDRPGERGGWTWILDKRGCPTAFFEAGEGWRNLEPFPSILMRGMRNFCKATGVLKGQPEMPSLQVRVSKRREITVSRGGMSHLYVKPGQYVRKGELLGDVRDMYDDVVEELRAPVNGIIQRCSLLPIVATGARVCNIAETDRGEEWERRVVPALESQITLAGRQRERS